MTAASRRYASVVFVLLMAPAVPVFAQAQRAPAVPRPPRFDLSIGGGVLGPVSLGDRDANLRANATTPQDYRLFSTESTMRLAPAFDLRVAGSVAGRFAIEGQMLFGKPKLRTEITDDAEAAPDVSVSQTLTELLFGGGVRVRLDNMRPTTRARPYVSAGAGLLKQTMEDDSLDEQSQFLYVGGGLLYATGRPTRGSLRQGVRVDAQVLMLKEYFGLDKEMTPRLSVTGGFFVSF